MGKEKEQEEDRMSELPDEILSHILSFLPVADAFALKLLSHRWSRLQVPLSNLYFNQETIFGTKYSPSDVLVKLKSEFVEKVDWFLNLFRGPYLNTFMVDFCLDNDSASVIDHWVSYAVSRQAESIELDFTSILSDDTRSQNLYKFPFHLLPEPKHFTPRLKHLQLSACLVLLTPHSSFNCLKTLELKNLPLDQTSLDAVFSSCLVLEWMTLEECELPPAPLRVCSARLRGLRVYQFNEFHTRTIELNAAQLQAFEFTGRSLKLSFLVVPPCQTIHFGLRNPYAAQTFFDLLAEVRPTLQLLSLAWYNPNNIPARIPEFSCLKQLEFFSTQYREFDLLSITNLLSACPMLQKLHLAMSLNYRCPEIGKTEEVEYPKNMKYLHLEEIKFSRFRGTPDQMELVIHLLNNAIALKHMTLIYSQWKSHKFKWENVQPASWSKWLTEKEFHDSLCKEMTSHGAKLIIC